MHDNFQFAATIVTILAGILFARTDIKQLRADFRRMDARINEVASDVKALRKDYTEFYAEQRRHDEAIETLKKK